MIARPQGHRPTVRYRAYGLTLSCTGPIQELAQTPPPEAGAETDLHIVFAQPGEPVPSPSDWYLTISLADGSPWMRCAKVPIGYLLDFPNLAYFAFDISNHSLHCIPQEHIPPHTLHHLLLDQVLPLVLNYKGKEALHGAAVVTPYGACAFVGITGAGKSTLAAGFLSAGYAVLTDDCVVLETRGGAIVAIPAYPSLRLWDDAIAALFGTTGSYAPVAHYTPKQRFAAALATSHTASAVPLAGIYVLGAGDSTQTVSPAVAEISPMLERDALMTLLSLAFKLDIRDRDRLTQELDFLRHVVTQVPVRRLTVPDSLAALPAVQDTILQDLTRSC